jgi:predicted tellurium resistance membrane protein TerC
MDFSAFLTAEGLISLLSLTALEIVLGVDNIVFIAIVSQRVEASRRSVLRRTGLGLALVMRLGLLFTLSWIMRLTRPLFTVLGHELSGRDLVLLGGGLFLIAKATHELFYASEGDHGAAGGSGPVPSGSAPVPKEKGAGFGGLLVQILILDIVFSLDSVITAVGMARHISIMVTAMIIAVGVMLAGANLISNFIHRHPSMKVLALSFLMLVGVLLVADAFGRHISKGYVYFAMGYALAVELINIRRRKRATRLAQTPADAA